MRTEDRSERPDHDTTDERSSNVSEQLLLREFDETWAHYRHLESTRSQYLGFFFTVTLAAIGAGIPAARSDATAHGGTLLLILVFLVVYGELARFLYVSIVKMGAVLALYDLRRDQVRTELHLDPSKLSVRTLPSAALGSQLFSVQRSAETVLQFAQVLTVVVEIVVAVRLFTLDSPAAVDAVGLILVLVSGTLVLVTAKAGLVIARERRGRLSFRRPHEGENRGGVSAVDP